MSHNLLTKFEQPLQIELQPSRQLARLSLLVHLLGALLWLLVSLPTGYKLLVLLFIAGHAWHFYRLQSVAIRKSSVSGISWDGRRGWRIYNPAKGWQSAALHTPVFVHSRLVAARFRVAKFRSCSAVIVSDRLASEEFRRLRVRLLQSARAKKTVPSPSGRRPG